MTEDTKLCTMSAVMYFAQEGMDLTPSLCGEWWNRLLSPGITQEDELEIHLYNPHIYGNEGAYREFLKTLCNTPDTSDVLEKYLEPYHRPFQVAAWIFLVTEAMLIGACLIAAVNKLPDSRALGRFGLQARRVNKDKRADARLKALELRAEGMKAKEVSQATGFHAAYVTTLVAMYREKELEYISGNHYGGNRRNMSFEAEATILPPFKERAEKGKRVETSEIKMAYQKAVGHSIGTSQILHRHGWRKIMPRSRHPQKADEKVIETSKK